MAGRAGSAGFPSGPRAPGERRRQGHLRAARDATHVTPGGAGRGGVGRGKRPGRWAGAAPLPSRRIGSHTAEGGREGAAALRVGEETVPAGRGDEAFPRSRAGAARPPAERLRHRPQVTQVGGRGMGWSV